MILWIKHGQETRCFDRIKVECPSYRKKLHAVAGNIGLLGLGIGESDQQLLAKQVDIVFHVAAAMKFDEQLNTAILQNVRGTREMLNLCRTFKKLRSVIYVSTIASNCTIEREVEERIYAPPIASDQAILLAETLPVEIMNVFNHKLRGQWPNNYTFTKAVAEHAVKHYGEGMPVGIFRPNGIMCTMAEPMPGWVGNFYGPLGVIAGVYAGMIRTIQLDGSFKTNVAPCDMAVNGMIASAWDVAENRSADPHPVYNYCTSRENERTHGELIGLANKMLWEFPPSKSLWFASISYVPNRWLYLILRLLLHTVPALLMDLILILLWKPPQMVRNYRKINKFLDVIAFFLTNQWTFEDKNMKSVWKKLGTRDRILFDFDMSALSWEKFFDTIPGGLRLYLMKDKHDTLPTAKRRYYLMYFLHRFTQCLLVLTAFWILSLGFKGASQK